MPVTLMDRRGVEDKTTHLCTTHTQEFHTVIHNPRLQDVAGKDNGTNLFFNKTSQYLASNSGDLEVDFRPDVTALLLINFPQA